MSGRATTPPPQGDVNVSGGLLATTILVTVISILLLAARFATRIWIVKRVGWDDWTILLAVLGHPIGMALVVVQIGYGLGRPVFYLTEHQFQEFMKYAYGEWLQTFATLMFTKISICLFLLRITISKSFVRPLQAAIGILVVSNVILTVLWIVQCTPHLDKAWNTKLSGKCFGKGQLERIIIAQASKLSPVSYERGLGLSTKVISFISDYFLSIFPILILRKVQISFRSKVGLCSLMGLGVVSVFPLFLTTIANAILVAPLCYLTIANFHLVPAH
ncbi:uncharacterized protein KY384_005078 [Bacidia gigantensis]|uniref:uncharacterized protein n=1 Tax=Bacidia gigantensis TaxID=2732470 RepID=UPI001D058B24|nr:uncharacterized protein KY384_005078 [Bacidia gigantensis]KAG8530575.1 hypothetical protein KY384_005078 [Bacidia gigantensis]